MKPNRHRCRDRWTWRLAAVVNASTGAIRRPARLDGEVEGGQIGASKAWSGGGQSVECCDSCPLGTSDGNSNAGNGCDADTNFNSGGVTGGGGGIDMPRPKTDEGGFHNVEAAVFFAHDRSRRLRGP
jgi:hypothetical protein